MKTTVFGNTVCCLLLLVIVLQFDVIGEFGDQVTKGERVHALNWTISDKQIKYIALKC